MRRRDLVALIGAMAATAPLAARAQRKAMPIIGILGEGFPENPAIVLNLAMFRRGLKQEGFVEGQNVQIKYEWAHNRPQMLPELAAKLVALPVDVLVNEGGTITAVALKKATSTIPVVFHASDAVDDGLVGNLARPDGNLTGVSQFSTGTLTKAFQLLTELAPSAKVIALISVGVAPAATQRTAQEIQAAKLGKEIELRVLTAQTDAELEAVFSGLAQLRAAVIVFANATYIERLVALAARFAVPAVYSQRGFALAGGLLSYGASIPAAYVIKGIYTGKILKGARPADLPVQQASKFEMVLNLKTADALGLRVPQSILIAADEVIE